MNVRMVDLPLPTPAVEIGCTGCYMLLGVASISRFFHGFKKINRKRIFHLIMAAFSIVRSISILVTEEPIVRDLLNRLSVCLLFTVILFHVLFWLDIVNPKVSSLSKRLWRAFTVANIIFYSSVFLIGFVEVDNPDSVWFGAVPVLIIALGSFLISVGFLYSSCKMHERVARLLDQADTKKIDHQLQLKLDRGLRLMNFVMGVSAVAFLLRTFLYFQRPFSHKECGSIKDPDLCLIIGYILPELVPCVLLLILMWDVEPKLWLKSRKLDEMASPDRLPLLGEDSEFLKTTSSSSNLTPSHLGFSHWGRRSSTTNDVRKPRMGMSGPSLSSMTSSIAVSSASQRNESKVERKQSSLGKGCNEFVWFSFQCFNLQFPTNCKSTMLLLQMVRRKCPSGTTYETVELGRTENISKSSHPWYNVMLPAPLPTLTNQENNDEVFLKVLIYVITHPAKMHDLNSQWLLGESTIDKHSFSNSSSEPCYGTAVVEALQSPLSRSTSVGIIVARIEMNVVGIGKTCKSPLEIPKEKPNKLTRGFLCFSENGKRMLIEEDLVESPYTWEIPYQLLQLLLIEFETKLSMFQNGECNPSQLFLTRSQTSSNVDLDSSMETDHPESTLLEVGTPKKNTSNAGIFDEMIFQIREDAQERKEKEWRVKLHQKMEEYISILKNCIERYGESHRGGLTFKPSTMKEDSRLRFLALNLHQQVMNVGFAVSLSPQDVSENDSAKYMFFLRSMAEHRQTQQGNDLQNRIHWNSNQWNKSTMDLEDETTFVDLEDETTSIDLEDEITSIDLKDETASIDLEDASHCHIINEDAAVEPEEALRKRLISFDSAEMIVKGMQKVPQEQQKLAESVVTLGATYAAPPSLSLSSSLKTEFVNDDISKTTSTSSPLLKWRTTFDGSIFDVVDEKMDAKEPSLTQQPCIYGTVTVGAFAAHAYGFKKGGIRQLKEQLDKLDRKSQKKLSVPKHSSGLTIYALDRDIQDLELEIQMRMSVAYCQAVSALVTSFQQTLYIELYSNPLLDPLRGTRYLNQLSEIGFLFSVESLLSTYGKEAGMLGDMAEAIGELRRVSIKFNLVHSAMEASYKLSISSQVDGVVIELPIILGNPCPETSTSMHRTYGQDLESGAVYLMGRDLPERLKSKNNMNNLISIVPVLFTQGVNEMQTVANTVGKSSLQKEINLENMEILNEYATSYVNFMNDYLLKEEVKNMKEDMDHLLCEILKKIQRNTREKCMDIVILTSDLARKMHGGRVTCCKSAKDRTSMSITLEESRILLQRHGVSQNDMNSITQTLRSHGVRRENARKNIGTAQYCFSSFQNYLLPHQYQCPPGTGGGSQNHT